MSETIEQLSVKLESAERALADCRNGHELYRADAEARMARFVRERDEARAQLAEVETIKDKYAIGRDKPGEPEFETLTECLEHWHDEALLYMDQHQKAWAQVARLWEALEKIGGDGKPAYRTRGDEFACSGCWAYAGAGATPDEDGCVHASDCPYAIVKAALAETPAQSLEAIRAEAKREAQREMQSSTFGELVKGCEMLSHRIESHEWDNMPVWAQRDWLIQQAEILHQQWAEKWRRTLDREAEGKERIRAEAGRERAVRELEALADRLRQTATVAPLGQGHDGLLTHEDGVQSAIFSLNKRRDEIAKEGKPQQRKPEGCWCFYDNCDVTSHSDCPVHFPKEGK